MRTSNPALSSDTFRDVESHTNMNGNSMTINSTVNKTFILLILSLLPAIWVWTSFFAVDGSVSAGGMAIASLSMIGGGIGGLIVAIITIFKKEWAPITAPLYAVLKGFALGGISATFEMQYGGIVIQAVGLTFGTLFALLMVYRSGLIKVTENFRLGLLAATGGIALVYLATFILSFFHIQIPLIHESGMVGIGFSIFVVIIAAMNLVLDFDFIEQGAESNAPQYMEWYAAFGLMVTLIWLYIEILRLLAKLRDRK